MMTISIITLGITTLSIIKLCIMDVSRSVMTLNYDGTAQLK